MDSRKLTRNQEFLETYLDIWVQFCDMLAILLKTALHLRRRDRSTKKCDCVSKMLIKMYSTGKEDRLRPSMLSTIVRRLRTRVATYVKDGE
jgi:hypothetical protein